jgi:hypothetical protein
MKIAITRVELMRSRMSPPCTVGLVSRSHFHSALTLVSALALKRKGVPLGPFQRVDFRSFYDDYPERNGGRPFRFYS